MFGITRVRVWRVSNMAVFSVAIPGVANTETMPAVKRALKTFTEAQDQWRKANIEIYSSNTDEVLVSIDWNGTRTEFYELLYVLSEYLSAELMSLMFSQAVQDVVLQHCDGDFQNCLRRFHSSGIPVAVALEI